MYSHLPLELYQRFLKTIVTLLLTRLQNSKSPKFQKDFVVSCSLFVHRDQQQRLVLVGTFNEIQPGLLLNLLSGIWLAVLKMSLRLDERKVCTLALVKIMLSDEVRSNPQALAGCSVALVSLLGLLPSTAVTVAQEESEDELPVDGGAGQEFEVSFSKLKNTDLPGAGAGLAPDVPDLCVAAKAVLQPHAQAILQLAQSQGELQPLVRFLQ